MTDMKPAAPIVAAMLLIVLASLSACGAEIEARRSRRVFDRALEKAQQGDPGAAVTVGWLYRRGIGTVRDPARALHWYDVGGPNGGWTSIGDMYTEGDGVPRDAERAASYYRRATETGDPISMYRLGCLHADRRIEAADAVEGYMWLLLAEKIGASSLTCHASHYDCREWVIGDRPGCRARLAAALTPEQRAEAERLAAARLTPRPPPGRR
jgi:TPR repeat protein